MTARTHAGLWKDTWPPSAILFTFTARACPTAMRVSVIQCL